MVEQSAACAGCGRAISEAELEVEPRVPCPDCGGIGRNYSVHATATVEAKASLGMKGKTPGERKPFFESVSGSFQRGDNGRWVKKDRLIDRRDNRYSEHVEDEDTGEVYRHIEEPLSDHRGRGSARREPPNAASDVGDR